MVKNLNYSYSITWSPVDHEYVATSDEFPGLSALSDKPEEAIADLRGLIEAAIEALEEDGEAIPAPRVVEKFRKA